MKATILNQGKGPRSVPLLRGGYKLLQRGEEATVVVASSAVLAGFTVVRCEEEPPVGGEIVNRMHLDHALAQLPGDQTDPEYVVRMMRSFYGDLFTDADELLVRDLVKPLGDLEDLSLDDEEEEGEEEDGEELDEQDDAPKVSDKWTKAILAEYLTKHGVAFETDANKPTLLELALAKEAELAAPKD